MVTGKTKQSSRLLKSQLPLSIPTSLSQKRLFWLELQGTMRATCSPNVHMKMDTLLLDVQCYFRQCWTDRLCSKWGRSMPQRGNFYRTVSSPYTKCPYHFARVEAEWGRSLLNIRITNFPLACSLQSWGLHRIMGILVVFWSPSCAQLQFLPSVRQVLGAQQLLEHSKSVHILTNPNS